jgi:hypothetical protein
VREPWETLLGQYRDHWFLAPFLDGDTPLLRAIQNDDRWWTLSSGEQAMVAAAAAIVRLNECWLAVDDDDRARIDTALRIAIDV